MVYPIIDGLKDSKKLDVSIFPNPATNRLKVEFENHGETRIALYDLAGKKVISMSPNDFEKANNIQTTILLPELVSSGSYVLKVSSGDRIAVKPLMIQK